MSLTVEELAVELKALERLHDAACRACQSLYGEKFISAQKALELQALEYERRLADLNGEAGRLRAMQATYMPREVFDNINEGIQENLRKLNEFKSNQEGRQIIIPSLLAAVVSIAIGLLFFFLNRMG